MFVLFDVYMLKHERNWNHIKMLVFVHAVIGHTHTQSKIQTKRQTVKHPSIYSINLSMMLLHHRHTWMSYFHCSMNRVKGIEVMFANIARNLDRHNHIQQKWICFSFHRLIEIKCVRMLKRSTANGKITAKPQFYVVRLFGNIDGCGVTVQHFFSHLRSFSLSISIWITFVGIVQVSASYLLSLHSGVECERNCITAYSK